MSSLSPFGRKEVAICVDKADALALKISTSQLSIGEEVRPQSVLGDILACLPEDGAQGAGVEMTAAPERRRSLGMDRFHFQGDDQWCVLCQPQFAQIFAGQVKLDRFA